LLDTPAIAQYHFNPEGYLDAIRAELPRYDELQERTAQATAGIDATEILELGTGTGETALRILALHPAARLTGIDESPTMLEQARRVLPAERLADLRVARLQDALPHGPFDLAVSTLAVHHLTRDEKRDLFPRVLAVLRPGGRFVLSDVVVPERPEDAITPIEEGFDLPDRVGDQLEWLRNAGFEPHVTWAWKDVAVIAATRP
jgi:tRNA (cmo5U34)-methyltransferase